jgi:hypothetical protein
MINKICLLTLGNIFLNTSYAAAISVDNFTRLINYPGKIEVACPKQDKNTAVLLVIGQSNAANHGEKKFLTKYPSKVFSYFNGKCFVASSPLLGASGIDGEFITPLADKLIDNGDYKSVVIIASAIGGTPIKLWQKGGDLNSMMLAVLAEVGSKFKVTDVIWHQGETDFSAKTATEKYKDSFNSLLKTIRSKDNLMPPVYYAIATKCGPAPDWTANNPIAEAQRSLANSKYNIYLGADTDNLLLKEDRSLGQCHFSEKGQLKTAEAFAKAIHKYKIK